MPELSLPRFKHSNCTACVYLGQTLEADLYFCNQSGLPTLIARFSSKEPDYSSGLQFAATCYRLAKNFGAQYHSLAEAYRLYLKAKKKGLLP